MSDSGELSLSSDDGGPPVVCLGAEQEQPPSVPRQRKSRGRSRAGLDWNAFEGCWVDMKNGTREAPFDVGDDVSAL